MLIMDANNYIDLNRESWNNRVEPHLKSEFYDLESFLKGKNSLNEIELNLLGDIKGKSILHLQCHFGQDTISLSRLGAKVTGVDLSDKSIEKANELANQTNSDAQFVDHLSLADPLANGYQVNPCDEVSYRIKIVISAIVLV